ncbi:MAG: phosphopantothenoylcysteine decarboxylase [Desulfuromonadales bacterium]
MRVTSAQEMYDAVLEKAGEADVIIKAAAVADYRPVERAMQKTKKGQTETLTVALQRNPDILAELGRRKEGQILVGFAAETDHLLEHARDKLQAKNLDMIVANDVTQKGAGFDADTNIVRLLTRDGQCEELPQMPKSAVASSVLDRVAAMLSAK